jgi:predicted DCC family thiol-disulfide oxidoreductase YuxK
MGASPLFPIRIFFDGACPLCRSKMGFYERMEHGGRLQFIDVTAPEFDPVPFGIAIDAFMHEIHAIDQGGRIYRGVDVFLAIWQAFPDSRWYSILTVFVALPGVNYLARLIYRVVARIRRFLPQRGYLCKGGSCKPLHHGR